MTPRPPLAAPYRDVEAVVIAAARDMLAEGSVDRLTIEGVAARTGVAKTTLYRRWRSKKELALAVVLDMARTVAAGPTGPDVRTALTGYLSAAVDALSGSLMGRVMQGLASDLATDPELGAAFRREVIELRRAHLAELVQAAVDRGEVRADLDVDLLQDVLFGPVYYRLLMSGRPLEPSFAEEVVDAALPALRP